MKEKLTLFGLVAVYLLASIRYFPGNAVETGYATFKQLLTVAPFAAGGTILFVSFIQRTSGGKVPWDRSLRVFLTIGICLEFLFAIYDYAGGAVSG